MHFSRNAFANIAWSILSTCCRAMATARSMVPACANSDSILTMIYLQSIALDPFPQNVPSTSDARKNSQHRHGEGKSGLWRTQETAQISKGDSYCGSK
jgi:hypothetical protein